MPDKKIDGLWHMCGFIIEGRDKDFKALRKHDIERIRKSLQEAEEVVANLLLETPIDEFRKNLEKAEKE